MNSPLPQERIGVGLANFVQESRLKKIVCIILTEMTGLNFSTFGRSRAGKFYTRNPRKLSRVPLLPHRDIPETFCKWYRKPYASLPFHVQLNVKRLK